jgi:hypothetical protein
MMAIIGIIGGLATALVHPFAGIAAIVIAALVFSRLAGRPENDDK